MPAGAELKRPESVLVVIYTAALDCLLLERVQPPGFWQSVTGTLRWDETHAQCAAREVREETGLDPVALRDAHIEKCFPILPAWRSRYAAGVETNLEHLWYLELPAVRDIRRNEPEHRAHEWLPIDAAILKVSSWTNRETLERLRDERAVR
jgi:dATP pyrophosphohydrolase